MTDVMRSLLAVAATALVASGVPCVWADSSRAPTAPATAATPAAVPDGALGASDPQAQRQWQLLGNYCEKCHNLTDWTGGIAFETMQPEGIASDAKVWEAAVRKLRGRMMPPPGQKQPDQATVDSFVAFMETHLDEAARTAPDPGYVALHRLNRTEYARSIKAILDLDVDASALLPKDVKSDGFDNVANVLKVSPTFLDQYISAARTVAALAVGDPHATKAIATYRAGRQEQAFHIEGLPLGTRGGMLVTHAFPADGEYEFSIGIFSGVGYIIGLDYPHRVILTLDDRKVFEQQIGGPKDLTEADQHPIESDKDLKARFAHIKAQVSAGPHRIGIAFVERSHAESDDWLQPLNPMGGEDRIPRITGVEVVGPYHPTGLSDTPSRRRIFSCRPTTPEQELSCARQILGELARAAYRRPVAEEDLAAPLRFYEKGRAGKSFDAGIESALVAILSSPKFLFRIETPPPLIKAGGTYRVDDLALASRLSFFLWSEGPDEELLRLAAAGELHEPQVLRGEVRRMLADARADALVTNFAFQWLQVDSMDKVEPDVVEYPEFDEDLRSAFRREMELFVANVLLEDHDVRDLLTANYTYVNERLALHYGIANVRGAQFRRVALADSHRYGLLGKGAILMGSSYGNRTAPVLRGAWVLESVTGTPPHAPPANVKALLENVPGGRQLTIRERMQMHRQQASCNACHGVLDPIGLSLENFNALGQWQTKDRDAGTPIDAVGRLADGTQVSGPDDLRRALLARPDQFVETLTEKLMTFALGRTLSYHDMPTVRAIVRAAAPGGYRFGALVQGIVDSAQFQEQHLPGAGTEGKPDQMTTQASNPH